MMTTDERSQRAIEPVTKNSGWLIMVTALLLLAVVAMGSWILIDRFGTTDADRLMDDYRAAWVDNDPEALLDLVTNDFRMTDVWAGETFNVRTIADRMDEFDVNGATWTTEVGDITTWGDWVSMPETLTFMGDTFEFDGVSVFRLEDGLIAEHFAVSSRTR